jgi:release factor glutamine methyltransferase
LREEEAHALERMVQRRVAGEPLAYVVGTKEFWSLNFRVTTDTLIPRADSECLIESLTVTRP